MLYEGINVNTQQTAEPYTIPAPVGGLNRRDSLSAMAETDAYVMDNMFPGTTSCLLRGGCSNHQTNIGTIVQSLEVFGGDVSDVLLAVGDGKIQNVTAVDVHTDLKTGLLSSDTVSTMFSTVADNAQFLILATGADDPMSFDGAAITDLVITGVAGGANSLHFVCSYKSRLYWAAEGQLGFYYLAPGAIQGAAEYFDLGQIAKGGGYVQAIATYSEDAGNGPDDYIVFITNRGEYIMYTGDDPGDAASWSLVGRYKYAEPIGRKCVQDYAGDLIVLTLQGAVQFSQIRKLADTRFELSAMTSKLGDALLDMNIYDTVPGWSMALYPKGGWFMVTAPGSSSYSGRYYHFVMNTTTQAWTRFYADDWDGIAWAVANKKLYFGRYDGSIRVADSGQSDMGNDIRFSVRQAYNYFRTPQFKHFKWAQFLVKSEAPVNLVSNLSVDYKEEQPDTVPSPFPEGVGSIWDLAFWDLGEWGSGAYTQNWITPYGKFGVVGSHWLEGTLKGASLEWFSTQHVFEKATGLLG